MLFSLIPYWYRFSNLLTMIIYPSTQDVRFNAVAKCHYARVIKTTDIRRSRFYRRVNVLDILKNYYATQRLSRFTRIQCFLPYMNDHANILPPSPIVFLSRNNDKKSHRSNTIRTDNTFVLRNTYRLANYVEKAQKVDRNIKRNMIYFVYDNLAAASLLLRSVL